MDLTIGSTQNLKLECKDAGGNVVSLPTNQTTWTVTGVGQIFPSGTDPAKATFNAGLSTGSAVVTCVCGTLSDSITINVTPGPAVSAKIVPVS